MSKILAVIGATGAQGLPVVKHLLSPSPDGTPSPWRVRALTRTPDHWRARKLVEYGAELVLGSFMDTPTIEKLLDGAYGVFVNTDGFTVGTEETTAAFNIWEICHYLKVRHFIWSNLDYSLRLGNYDPQYRCQHYNGKGRFAAFLENQPNPIDDPTATIWSIFTTGPYLDMLIELFAAYNIREDGTRVWISPFGAKGDTGTLPLVALEDIGWWARYMFDTPAETTGKEIALASDIVTYPQIVETFERVTGIKGAYKSLEMDEFFALWKGDTPVASAVPRGITWEQNFRAFFAMWRDGIVLVKRDMDWLKSVHQPITMERWMRENDYDGKATGKLLKNRKDWITPHHLLQEKTRNL
ncbi:NAD(P)-binding protein [Clavulina sp. PMI_390]|nr:NAD(P)-binding protein [Clavulina sp. PMI_390]